MERTMTKMDSFRNAETGSIDWEAYKEAQAANGEICQTCGAGILLSFNRTATYTDCHQCREAKEEGGELHHSRLIRCPRCAKLIDPSNEDDWNEIWSEEGHEIDCPSCEESFVVVTHVSYSFTSPPRKALEEAG